MHESFTNRLLKVQSGRGHDWNRRPGGQRVEVEANYMQVVALSSLFTKSLSDWGPETGDILKSRGGRLSN